MPIPLAERPVFVILLAQGGEFGFVVFQAAQQAGVIDGAVSSLLVAAVAVSMLISPLALVLADKWLLPRLAQHRRPKLAEIDEPQNEQVIIAGFGRYGQIVGRLLLANGIQPPCSTTTAKPSKASAASASTCSTATRRAWTAAQGRRRRSARARRRHRRRARKAWRWSTSRANTSRNWIVARARNVQHLLPAARPRRDAVERETFDSALMSARGVLETLGFERHQARNLRCAFAATTSSSSAKPPRISRTNRS